jgi:hypothetical protein
MTEMTFLPLICNFTHQKGGVKPRNDADIEGIPRDFIPWGLEPARMRENTFGSKRL